MYKIFRTLSRSVMIALMCTIWHSNSIIATEAIRLYSEPIITVEAVQEMVSYKEPEPTKPEIPIEELELSVCINPLDILCVGADTQNIIEEKEPELSIPDEDIELIALLTMAEAEGECEKGKRLVIDTILNRVDSEHFPNTVYDVIYQKNQFTSMWNGRANRVKVTEEIRQLVREEYKSRTNTDVIFFTAYGYGRYGDPMFQVGNHYFSSY